MGDLARKQHNNSEWTNQQLFDFKSCWFQELHQIYREIIQCFPCLNGTVDMLGKGLKLWNSIRSSELGNTVERKYNQTIKRMNIMCEVQTDIKYNSLFVETEPWYNVSVMVIFYEMFGFSLYFSFAVSRKGRGGLDSWLQYIFLNACVWTCLTTSQCTFKDTR